MDLLLTHGHFLGEDPKEQSIMKPYAPLGLLYLSAYLKNMGFKVEVYDSTFGSRDELFGILRAGPPATIGVYANLTSRPSVVEIIKEARREGWTVILGGPEPAEYAREYLDAGAGVIVAGEGEVPLGEILSATHGGTSSFHGIAGLVFQDRDGSLVRTKQGSRIDDLDTLPWPDRGSINLNKYLDAWRTRHGVGSLSVVTARGCPYQCHWCSRSIFGRSHRRRSVKFVADELESLLDRYAPEMLWIADDVFTISETWVLEYAREMKRRGLRVPFECTTRADRINANIAGALAEAGCFRVWIGCESGSQRILDAMGRGIKVHQAVEALGICRASGIETGVFLMWGYQGEEASDIEATVEFVKNIRPDAFLTTVSYPIKGTVYFNEIEPQLSNIREWSKSTDRDLAIAGRRPREYYANADRYLRAEMALQKLDCSEEGKAAQLQREINESMQILRSWA